MEKKMVQKVVLLSLCISTCTAREMACHSRYSSEYRNVTWQCSGMKVKHVPRMLPRSLRTLLLNGTGISSLDRDSFQGRDLPDLTTLSVIGGKLASVRAHAFCDLPELTILNLDHNRLSSLDELSFSCNQFLRSVSLVGNPSLCHLPPLVSNSVQYLYLDNCSLDSIDVATVERVTALKVLSLVGNPDLHCPSVESQFKQSRPDLLVICKDPATDLPSSTSHNYQEKSFDESDSTVKSTEKDSTVNEQESHNDSDSAIKNKEKDTATNTASRISLPVTAIAVISIVIITTVMLLCLVRSC